MIEEITIQELAAMEPSACQIIDMRDSTAFALGHIDGAVLIPQKELEVSHENLPKDKTLVIYCRSGILSADVAEQLREEGYAAVNLVGGYVKWLQEKIRRETKNEKAAEVEQARLVQQRKVQLVKAELRVRARLAGKAERALTARAERDEGQRCEHGRIAHDALRADAGLRQCGAQKVAERIRADLAEHGTAAAVGVQGGQKIPRCAAGMGGEGGVAVAVRVDRGKIDQQLPECNGVQHENPSASE